MDNKITIDILIEQAASAIGAGVLKVEPTPNAAPPAKTVTLTGREAGQEVTATIGADATYEQVLGAFIKAREST